MFSNRSKGVLLNLKKDTLTRKLHQKKADTEKREKRGVVSHPPSLGMLFVAG